MPETDSQQLEIHTELRRCQDNSDPGNPHSSTKEHRYQPPRLAMNSGTEMISNNSMLVLKTAAQNARYARAISIII